MKFIKYIKKKKEIEDEIKISKKLDGGGCPDKSEALCTSQN